MSIQSSQQFLNGLLNKRRQLALPIELAVTINGKVETITLQKICRLLPGKRVVCDGLWQHRRVAVKLFVDSEGAKKHCQRETAAYKLLTAANIPTAEYLQHFEVIGGSFQGLLYAWLDNTDDVLTQWKSAELPEKKILFVRTIALIRKMHDAGLVQQDIHFGNFMADHAQMYVLDLGAIQCLTKGKSLSVAESIKNLAKLIAQLGVAEQKIALDWLNVYVQENRWLCEDINNHIEPALHHAWKKRLDDYLKKSARECRLTRYEQSFWKVLACRRDEYTEDMQFLFELADQSMQNVEILKDGNTATVVKIKRHEKTLIIKRYNLKSFWHAIARLFQSSRAAISWRNAHMLELAEIPATLPVALIENRWGILRRNAYFISNAIDGEDLLFLGENRAMTVEEYNNLYSVLQAMMVARITHGDMKANNLIINHGRIHLIDLDAMERHKTLSSFKKYWSRDMDRLSRNWASDAPIFQQIQTLLNTLNTEFMAIHV